jgi:hypothetical protein
LKITLIISSGDLMVSLTAIVIALAIFRLMSTSRPARVLQTIMGIAKNSFLEMNRDVSTDRLNTYAIF